MRFFLKPNSASAVCFAVSLLLSPNFASSSSIEDFNSYTFFGNDRSWLLDQNVLSMPSNSKNPAALQEVGRLFRENDPRAPIALQNYIDRHPRDAGAFDLAGVILLQEGNYREAMISFNRALQFMPDSPWLMAKLGVAQVELGQSDRAQRSFERALELAPDNPLALRHMAQIAVQSNDFPRAVIFSERALRAFGMPRGTINQAHFDLAELYARVNRERDGLELLRPALDNSALDVPGTQKLELYGRYLEMAMDVQDPVEARRAFEKLGPFVNPEDPRVQLTHSRLLRLEGDTEGALALLISISDRNADLKPQLLPDMALTYEAAGRVAEASATWLTIAANQEPGADLPYLRQALLLHVNTGDPDSAMALLRDRLDAREQSAELAMLELEILGRVGRSKEALESAKSHVLRYPSSVDLLEMLGTLASAQGETDLGISALESAVALEPTEPKLWLLLAGITHGHGSYIGTGHSGSGVGHTEIEALLRRAIDANPASADIRAELGLMLLSDGRVEEAVSTFDGSLQQNPAHLPSLTLGALARADANRELDGALAMINRASAMVPGDAIVQDITGWVLVRQGATRTGLELLQKAAKAEPEDVTIQYHLGIAHQAIGDHETAIGHYRAALAGPNYAHNEQDNRARLIALTSNQEFSIPMARIDAGHEGIRIGEVNVVQTANGVAFRANLNGLDEGFYAAHVHVYGNCGSGAGAVGTLAGGHYGAGHHGIHEPHPAAQVDDVDKNANHTGVDHGGGIASMDLSDNMGATETSETMAASMGTADTEHATRSQDPAMEIQQMANLPSGDLPPFKFNAAGHSQSVLMHEAINLDEIRGRSLMLHVGKDIGGKSGPKIACGVIP